MNTQTRSTIRRFLGNRTAVVVAGTVGFMLGAGGFVAAQQGADDTAPKTTEVETIVDDTIDDDSTSTSLPDDDSAAKGANGTSTSLPDDDNDDDNDDSTSTSLPNDDNDDDSTSTSLPNDDNDDDSTSTSLPDDDSAGKGANSTSTSLPNDDDDDDSTSTSVPVALPEPLLNQTRTSAGGSIVWSWDGKAFTLDEQPLVNAGYTFEIEDNSWDRIRVDFEFADGNSGEGHNDSRIEVRLHEGSIRVSID